MLYAWHVLIQPVYGAHMCFYVSGLVILFFLPSLGLFKYII